MQCPTCKSPMNRLIWHETAERCRWCGTQILYPPGLGVFVPLVWSALQDSGGECLREDAAECMVWRVASEVMTGSRADE